MSVAEAAAFAHQGIDLVHGDAITVEGIEDALYWGHVGIVRGVSGGGTEIDRGLSGEAGEEESGEREERGFHGFEIY